MLINGSIIIVIIGIVTLLSAVIGEIVTVDVLMIGYISTTVLGVFTPQHILIGFIALVIIISIVVLVCKIILAFSKHKFTVCKR